MPVLSAYTLPATTDGLQVHLSPNGVRFFLSFHASVDPATQKPWCPDVVAAIPHLLEVFVPSSAPTVGFVHVGQKPEWKEPTNVFRTKWNVNNIPTLVRFERVDGCVKETGRLVEAEILDREKLREFVFGKEAAERT
ncbi:uncharacterized protein DSM5745_07878 [Aspergillus mulundensis]|uniref:Thioredoxin domain-containing protein n=1 Tax=Aspergillus mulundensis TaxID=1810919 RepID=A0A3D8RFH1_9EURO|nr:Uncharacterized protein DSM5745_07878 [Aspergillus mulundensis]RDW72706.1 Uncharacterized protein DSM5745_07878 [Aspergillus mulundensis]